METKRRKLSFVQISRAIAIIFVLLGHVNILFHTKFNYDWFDMGQWERTGGVDFFFIVTGFMIFYLYHKQAGRPGKAKEFLLKRVIRIYPLYWMFTLLSIAVSLLLPSAGGSYPAELIFKSILILPPEPILDSAWSLSHVVFFYLLFAAYIFRPKILKPLIAIWILATMLIGLKFVPFPEHSFIFSFSNLEIICGCVVAYLTLNFNFKYSTLFVTAGLLGYLAVWLNNIYQIFHIHVPLFFCIFSMLLMLGIAEKDKKERQTPKALSFLGDASYSIYIAHGPFLHLYILLMVKFHVIGALGYFLTMSAVIILTVLSCCLVYQLIEKPMLKYLRKVVFTKVNRSIDMPLIMGK
ncbi:MULTISPECIES: acyltransferase family protein [Bacillaceae]|uniref:acyltransferase family protein n=1 Tax=Bacillaceae TaxID=186817 RepID=UPI0016809D18|nr:acyltransferase [Bacillus sp. S3]